MRRAVTSLHGDHVTGQQRAVNLTAFRIPRGGLFNQVMAKRSDADGDTYWASTTGLGAPTAPGQVLDLSAGSINSNLLLTWTPPQSGGAAITDYIVEYADVGGVPSLFEKPTAQSAGVTNFNALTDYIEAGASTTVTTTTIFENKRFTKPLICQADVTLINCLVDAPGNYPVDAVHASARATLINTTITGGSLANVRITRGSLSACHIHTSGGVGVLVHIPDEEVKIEFCYIEKMGSSLLGDHPGFGVQCLGMTGAGSLVIRANNIFIPNVGEVGYAGDGGVTYNSDHPIEINAYSAAIQDVVIEGNWLTGGSYNLRITDGAKGYSNPTDWKLLSNQFSNPSTGYITADAGAIDIIGNTDEDTSLNIDVDLGGPLVGAAAAAPSFQVYSDGVSTATSLLVTGLLPAHLYQCRIKSVNSVGESVYSNVAEATTGGGSTTAPMVGFLTSSTTIAESDQQASITVVLSSPSVNEVRVPFSVTGNLSINTDYTLSPQGELVFPPGAITRSIIVSTISDSLIEGQEVATITLAPPVSGAYELEVGATSHVITVTDATAKPTMFFELASQSKNESAGSVTVVVKSSQVLTSPISVDIDFAGLATLTDDYSVPTQLPVTIAANTDTALVQINIVDDALFEDVETVVMTIQSNSQYIVGTQNTHTLSILDNEQNIVQFTTSASTLSEVGSKKFIELRLTTPAVTTEYVVLVLSGTAVNGVDYTTDATLVRFHPSEDTALFGITPIDNGIVNTGRQINVSIGPTHSTGIAPSVSNGVHVVTIQDDEGDVGDPINSVVDMHETFDNANNLEPLMFVNIPLAPGVTTLPTVYAGAPGSEKLAQVDVVSRNGDGSEIRVIQVIAPSDGAATLSLKSSGGAIHSQANSPNIPAGMANIAVEIDVANVGVMRCEPYAGVSEVLQIGPFYTVVRYSNHFYEVANPTVHAFTGMLYVKYRTDTDVVGIDWRFTNARFDPGANPYKTHACNDGRMFFDEMRFTDLPAGYSLVANVERANMDTANLKISKSLGGTNWQKVGPRGGFIRRYALYATGHLTEAQAILNGKHKGTAISGDTYYTRGYGELNASLPDWSKPGSTMTAPGGLTGYAAAKQRVATYDAQMRADLIAGSHSPNYTTNLFASEEGWWHGHGFDYSGAPGGAQVWNASGWWLSPRLGTAALMYVDTAYERMYTDLIDPVTFKQVTYKDILNGSTGTWPNYNNTGSISVAADEMPWAITTDNLTRWKIPQFLDGNTYFPNGFDARVTLLQTTKRWNSLPSGGAMPYGVNQDSFVGSSSSNYATPMSTHIIRETWQLRDAVWCDNDHVSRDIIKSLGEWMLVGSPDVEHAFRQDDWIKYTSMKSAIADMHANDGGIGGGFDRGHGHTWLTIGMHSAIETVAWKTDHAGWFTMLKDMFQKTVCASGIVSRLDQHNASGEVGSNYDYSSPNPYSSALAATDRINHTGRHPGTFTSSLTFHTCFVYQGLRAIVENSALTAADFKELGGTLVNAMESTYAGTAMFGWPYFTAVTIGDDGKADPAGATLPYWHIDPLYTAMLGGSPYPSYNDRHPIEVVCWAYLKDKDPQMIQHLKRIRNMASSSTNAQVRDNLIAFFDSQEINNLAFTVHMISELQKIA